MSVSPLSSSQAIVRFGDFEVDPRSGELRKRGLPIKLQLQPFRVLQALLEHAGEVVSREELQKTIWPEDTFVDFDHGLNNAVKKLREALGDNAEKHRFIETLSKLGYRFIAPVTVANSISIFEENTVGIRNGKQESRRWFVWSAATIAILAGILLAGFVGSKAFRSRGRVLATSTPQIQSLAVLPLVNLSGDPNQEYFSDGMTDALITDLAQISSVRVVSRTSSMLYKHTNKSLPDIAHELNVDGIVEGTVQRSGDRVRITAQLIHAGSDKHLWANSYERDVRNVFALQRDVTEDIARHVQERLTRGNVVQVTQPRSLDASVLDAYFLGNYHLENFGKGHGDEEKRVAAKYFQQAIDADANFAPAYNGLANSHLALLWPTRQDAEMAKAAARQATMLDPNLADAHRTLADLARASWDWSAAEDEYRRAISINPNHADAHDWLGHLLDATGRLDEGWKEQQLGQELDPNHNHLSDALSQREQHDRAITVLQMMLKRYPDDGYLHLGLADEYFSEHMYEEASFHLEETTILFGFPQIATEARRVRDASGYRAALRTHLKGWEHLMATHQAFAPVNIAEFYVVLGDKERAFYWLEQAYAQHDIAIAGAALGLEWLNSEALFDPIRDEPRFADLLRRVGLPH
jgi:TolB-like protein/DNA-binding winged helix-turn-helix (wHTH) protein/tetratricopeptide (TPR) repeat protein